MIKYLVEEAPGHFRRMDAIPGRRFLGLVDAPDLEPGEKTDNRLDGRIRYCEMELDSAKSRLEGIQGGMDVLNIAIGVLESEKPGEIKKSRWSSKLDEAKAYRLAAEVKNAVMRAEYGVPFVHEDFFDGLVHQVSIIFGRQIQLQRESVTRARLGLGGVRGKIRQYRDFRQLAFDEGYRKPEMLRRMWVPPSVVGVLGIDVPVVWSSILDYSSHHTETRCYVRIEDILPQSINGELRKKEGGSAALVKGQVSGMSDSDGMVSLVLTDNNNFLLCRIGDYGYHPITRFNEGGRNGLILLRGNYPAISEGFEEYRSEDTRDMLALLSSAQNTKQDVYVVGRPAGRGVFSADALVIGGNVMAHVLNIDRYFQQELS